MDQNTIPNTKGAEYLSEHESQMRVERFTEDGGEYDRVLGLSQGLINENFESLYRLNEGLGDISFAQGNVGIHGRIEPLRVVIPVEDVPLGGSDKIMFHIRFNSGSLKNKDGTMEIDDLAGWTFVFWNNIESDDSEDANYRSIEWLYMKLSRPNDITLDDERTMVYDKKTNTSIKYINWVSRPENYDVASRMGGFLQEWQTQAQSKSANLLGHTAKPSTDSGKKATTEPKLIKVRYQCYPYISEPDGVEKPKTGESGPANCNCFMVLETVEGGAPLPQNPKLRWSGNFATQGSGSSHSPIPATLLADYGNSWVKEIVPAFVHSNWWLCTTHAPLSIGEDANWGFYVWYSFGLVGCPGHRDLPDPFFDFKPDDLGGGRKLKYSWDYSHGEEFPDTEKSTQDQWVWNISTSSKVSNSVTQIGYAEIEATANVTSTFYSKWTGVKDPAAPASKLVDYKRIIKTRIRLNLKQDDDSSYFEPVWEYPAMSYEPTEEISNIFYNENIWKFSDRFKRNLEDAVALLDGELRRKVKSKFPVPRKTGFSLPEVSHLGDLNYKRILKDLEHGESTIIPSSGAAEVDAIVTAPFVFDSKDKVSPRGAGSSKL